MRHGRRNQRRRCAEALAAASYDVSEVVHDYEDDLTFEQVLGGVNSALSPDSIPLDRCDAFVEHLRRAPPSATTFKEAFPVRALAGIAR